MQDLAAREASDYYYSMVDVVPRCRIDLGLIITANAHAKPSNEAVDMSLNQSFYFITANAHAKPSNEQLI